MAVEAATVERSEGVVVSRRALVSVLKAAATLGPVVVEVGSGVHVYAHSGEPTPKIVARYTVAEGGGPAEARRYRVDSRDIGRIPSRVREVNVAAGESSLHIRAGGVQVAVGSPAPGVPQEPDGGERVLSGTVPAQDLERVIPFADEERLYLRVVAFTPLGVTATDGTVLAHVQPSPWPDEAAFSAFGATVCVPIEAARAATSEGKLLSWEVYREPEDEPGQRPRGRIVLQSAREGYRVRVVARLSPPNFPRFGHLLKRLPAMCLSAPQFLFDLLRPTKKLGIAVVYLRQDGGKLWVRGGSVEGQGVQGQFAVTLLGKESCPGEHAFQPHLLLHLEQLFDRNAIYLQFPPEKATQPLYAADAVENPGRIGLIMPVKTW